MGLNLWEHQKKSIELALTQDSFAFLYEPGCGKTGAVISVLDSLFKKYGRILKTLIITPPVVVQQFRQEFTKFSNISLNDIKTLTGPQKKRITEAWKGRILISNFESLLMKDLYEKLSLWGPEIMVIDESHRIKNPSSKRTKAAIRLGRKAKYRYILSGTPVLNSPADLFSQFQFLDCGATFGDNFYAFRSKFFYDKNSGMPKHIHFPNWQPRPGIQEQLSEMISPKSYRIKKEECLDLPPLVKVKVEVELSNEQRKNYEEMRKEFVTYVGSEACVASLAITRALRLQQIVSGHIRVSGQNDGVVEQKTLQYKATPREEALRELLEELAGSHKVIVWAVFKDNYESIRRVCEDLGFGYVEVHGEVSSSQRDAAIESFNSDPKVRVYLGHPGSGGIGVNLTVSSYAIFYSRSFSLEHTLQAEARNHRGGSEIHQKITRIDLVAKDTIDEVILEKLSNKEAMSENIIFSLAKLLSCQ